MRLLRIFAIRWLGHGRALGTVIVTALLLPICVRQCHSQTAYGSDHLSDKISGTVLNSLTHEPIDRALVYTLDERSAAFTDEHGHFELILAVTADMSDPRPRAEIHERLQAKKPGFVTEQGRHGSIDVIPGQNDVILSLVPEALIVGHVKLPSTEPADHVQVQLYRREVRNGFGPWVPQTTVTSLADGEFRFADLEAGEYKIFTLEATEQDPLAEVPNGPVFRFPPRFFAAARDFATADTIRLRAGEVFNANITPERQRYYDIRIPMNPAAPGGVPEMSVSVFAQGRRGPGFELGFDRSQNAIVGSLPNGSYTIEAMTLGTAGMTNITVANGALNGAPLTLAQNTSIEVDISQDMSGADNRLPQVKDAPNRPLAYVRLESAEEFQDQRNLGRSYQSNGDPPALLGVKPGRYWVQVQAAGGQGYASSVTSGGKDLLRGPLIVPFGSSVPPIEITMRYDISDLEVIVEDPAKGLAIGANTPAVGATTTAVHPREDVSVYCIPVGGNGGPPAVPNRVADGRYVMQIPPGDYLVLAFDTPQQIEYRNPTAMHAYESKGQVLHVTSGQKLEVRLQAVESE